MDVWRNICCSIPQRLKCECMQHQRITISIKKREGENKAIGNLLFIDIIIHQISTFMFSVLFAFIYFLSFSLHINVDFIVYFCCCTQKKISGLMEHMRIQSNIKCWNDFYSVVRMTKGRYKLNLNIAKRKEITTCFYSEFILSVSILFFVLVVKYVFSF